MRLNIVKTRVRQQSKLNIKKENQAPTTKKNRQQKGVQCELVAAQIRGVIKATWREDKRLPPRGRKGVSMLKIIDYELKGNVVRFYLGKPTARNYHGDDWNDKLHESNGNRVYSEYITGTAEIAFPFDALVLDPCTGEFGANCRYSKDDMKNRIVPCVTVVPPEIAKDTHMESYSYWAGCKEALRFYFGDQMEPSTGLVNYYFDSKQLQLVQQQEPRYIIRVPEGCQHGDPMELVPVWEKENLTITEAAAYFGIGTNRIRALTEVRNCDFVLFVGNRRLIKRKQFAKYLEKTTSI